MSLINCLSKKKRTAKARFVTESPNQASDCSESRRGTKRARFEAEWNRIRLTCLGASSLPPTPVTDMSSLQKQRNVLKRQPEDSTLFRAGFNPKHGRPRTERCNNTQQAHQHYCSVARRCATGGRATARCSKPRDQAATTHARRASSSLTVCVRCRRPRRPWRCSGPPPAPPRAFAWPARLGQHEQKQARFRNALDGFI